MNTSFFDSNTFFIDQQVNFLKFGDIYQIYNGTGNAIGTIRQKLTKGQKFVRALLMARFVPIYMEIVNLINEPQASISRKWNFFYPDFLIKDNQGNLLGKIRYQYHFFKVRYKILDKNDVLIAEITGDFSGWDFVIKDSTDKQFGAINKKWAGAWKEFFANADKYIVTIDPAHLGDNHRILILSAAISIDIFLKEWWRD